ncbi:MAG: Rieske (2Fe-2S) protein [Myxococcales bacterium]|nr:Rieske (2Fe-2S) protein [Myxococcota bacterium]MDW8282260.1 Rieske (2Fe-2S) protein [Myxococcales bacterium]
MSPNWTATSSLLGASPDEHPPPPRRVFLSRLVSLTTLAALGASALAGARLVLRYLYPRQGLSRRRRIFLAPRSELPPGATRSYTLPGGQSAIVRNTGTAWVALSDVCPHLGCKVRWDEAAGGFLCPCHAGLFSKEGKALRGPPADEGKDLRRYPVETIGDNIFIEIEEHL